MALLGDVAGGTGGSQLLHLGDTFGQHRVADVQPDRVILEGGGGERVIVRLGAGVVPGREASLRSVGPTAPVVVPSTVPLSAGGSRPSVVQPGGRQPPGQSGIAPGQSGSIPGQSGKTPGLQADEERGESTADKQSGKDQRQVEKERRRAEKDARRQRR